MKSVFDFFAGEDEYTDLDISGAVQRLSQAIQCNTVNYADHSKTDFSGFDRLQALICSAYPNIMKCGTFELIGHSVLITIPGEDPSLRPSLYMSHQDVVPVVEGTERDWVHDAFSGTVADGYIWGRGTLDIKNQVFGILEAVEYLLGHGYVFQRTAYLAFGDDEETLNLGARSIAQELRRRGVKLEFLLDESGGKIQDAARYGAPGVYFSEVDLMEKGYADLELSVQSRGGHSSRPFGGTSLAHLAGAIADIVRSPFEVRLPSPLEGTLAALKDYISQEPLRTLVQDIPSNRRAIAEYCSTVPELFPFVTTTVAPTMIQGGSSACNVMPQNMTAVINFRLNEGDTVQDVLAHCREAVQDSTVSMRYLQANDPSAVARSDGFGYQVLVDSMAHYYRDVVFVPAITVGGTDAHEYEIICDTCLRCCPFVTENADAVTGVHGTNERIPVRTYAQGIRVLIRLIMSANIQL